MLAILGIQPVDAIIDAAHPLGPQGLSNTGKLYEPFARADGGRASRLDLLRLSIAATTLMQHGRRSVVEFTLQRVQVALPKGRVIPEDFGEGRQLAAIDLGLHRP